MANSDEEISESGTNSMDDYFVSTLPGPDLNGSVIKGLTDITTAAISSAGVSSGYITNANTEDYWITSSSIDWSISATPFVDCMPDLNRVNEMCEEYPSLSKAYENFKTVYAMVEQDWKGKNK